MGITGRHFLSFPLFVSAAGVSLYNIRCRSPTLNDPRNDHAYQWRQINTCVTHSILAFDRANQIRAQIPEPSNHWNHNEV